MHAEIFTILTRTLYDHTGVSVYQRFTLVLLCTQVGKGSSEEKKVQQIPTSQFVMGMFKWFKIAKNKKIPWAILEGRWYTGRKIRQIWAEWAVCITWYLQNGPGNFFVFCNFESHKYPHNKLWSRNLLHFFSSELPLPTWV